MNRLVVFGCSHATADYNIEDDSQSWPALVAKHKQMQLCNRAVSGNSNDDIFLSVLNEKFNEGDLALVLMTHPHRVLIDKNLTVKPSQPTHQWWYKQITSDVFYQTNFLKCLLAIQQVLSNVTHLISFVDPRLLFTYPEHKKIITKDMVFLPKLVLSKTYELGADKSHMSVESHSKMSEFWIDNLNSRC